MVASLNVKAFLIASFISSSRCNISITENEELSCRSSTNDNTAIENENINITNSSNTGSITYTSPHYGIDYSWPQHNYKVHENSKHTFGNDRQSTYNNYIKGCYKKYDKAACIDYEKTRIEMNNRQPQSVYNYTKELGFKKIKAPIKIFNKIQKFWNDNKDQLSIEEFGYGDAAVNTWANESSYIIHVENDTLIGGGFELRDEIWDAAEETIRNWTGHGKMRTVSCYGIRVYKDAAILTSHVDRLPLVSSAIINVDQDVDEPW